MSMRNTVLYSLILIVLSCSHFKDDNNHILIADFTPRDWVQGFENYKKIPWFKGTERIQRVYDSSRKHHVLQVSYPKGAVGPNAGGAQWISYVPKSLKLKLSYWVKFSSAFDWVIGGKLPGLIGGYKKDKLHSTISGGAIADGTNGWSARIMWREGGRIVQYVYHMDKAGEWGDDFQWMIDGKIATFKAGQWHHLETEITMNEVLKKNARIRSWLDGNLALDVSGIRLRTIDTLQIDALYFSTFFGGNDSSFAPTKDEEIYFDDFEITKLN